MYWNEFQIKEMAKMFSLKPETVRYYNNIGILSSRRNEDNNYRTFDIDDVSNLGTVMLLRSLDIPIRDIQHFHDAADLESLSGALAAQQARIQSQLERLTRRQKDISGFYTYLSGIGDQLNQVTIQPAPRWRGSHLTEKLDITAMTKVYADLVRDTDYLPFYIFTMRREDFYAGAVRYARYGLVYEERSPQAPSSEQFMIGAAQCARYVFWGNKKEHLRDAYRETLEWTQRHRFTVTGEIIERFVFGTPTHTLMELWLPIE